MTRARLPGVLDADDPGPGPCLGICATHNARHAIRKSRGPEPAGPSVKRNSLVSCWMAGAPTAHGQPSSLPTRRCLASRAGEACGARVCPHPASFCFSPVGEYCQQPACWQGNEPPTLAALQPSPQGLAQAPSQSLGPLTHSCPMCRTQDSTWPAGRGGGAANPSLPVTRGSCKEEGLSPPVQPPTYCPLNSRCPGCPWPRG